MRIVIKLGGAVCLQSETLDHLAHTLTDLRARGHQPLVVHGGGPQLDAALQQLGEPTVKHKGLRYTSEAAAAVVERELDAIGRQIAEGLHARGVPTRHIAAHQRALHAQVKRLADGFDLGRVGSFAGLEPDAAVDLDHVGGAVPVVTPVGHDAHGPLNINADEAAAAVAAAIGAARLLLATDVPHVRDGAGNALGAIDERTAAMLITDGAAEGGMVPKLMAALAALEAGVGGVLITRPDPEAFVALTDAVPAIGTFVQPAPTTVDLRALRSLLVEVAE